MAHPAIVPARLDPDRKDRGEGIFNVGDGPVVAVIEIPVTRIR